MAGTQLSERPCTRLCGSRLNRGQVLDGVVDALAGSLALFAAARGSLDGSRAYQAREILEEICTTWGMDAAYATAQLDVMLGTATDTFARPELEVPIVRIAGNRLARELVSVIRDELNPTAWSHEEHATFNRICWLLDLADAGNGDSYEA